MRWLIACLVFGCLPAWGQVPAPNTEAAVPKRARSACVALMQRTIPGNPGPAMTVLARPVAVEEAQELVVRSQLRKPAKETEAALNLVQSFARWKWAKDWPAGYEIRVAPGASYPDADGLTQALPVALVVEGVIHAVDYDPKFGCAGGLTPYGFVVPVAGIEARVRGAWNRELTHIALPKQNLAELSDMIVKGRGDPLIRMQVFLVDGYYETRRLALASPDRDSVLNEAMRLYDEVRVALGPSLSLEALAQPELQGRLRKVVELEPGHFSARYLLALARGDAPRVLSIRGSVEYLDQAAEVIIKRNNTSGMAAQYLGLSGWRPKMNPSSLAAYDPLLEMADVCRELESPLLNPAKKSGMKKRLLELKQTFASEYKSLKASKEVIATSNLVGRLDD